MRQMMRRSGEALRKGAIPNNVNHLFSKALALRSNREEMPGALWAPLCRVISSMRNKSMMRRLA